MDIRAELPVKITAEVIETLHKYVEAEYPQKKTIYRWAGKLEVTPEGFRQTTENAQQILGYQFWSEDQKKVIQFRLDGFTLSRLHPYSKWEDLFQEAKRLWAIYVERLEPIVTTRFGTRYINSIVIPNYSIDLEEYFTAPPRIPPELPQHIREYLSRIVLDFPEADAHAVTTFASDPKATPGTVAVLFDIDVFKHGKLAPLSAGIWENFEQLRVIKNKVFEGSLTKKTKELFS